MEPIPPEAAFPGAQSRYYEFGDLRHAEIRRSDLRAVQDAIHRYESLAGIGQHLRHKDPVRREGAMQPEGDKKGLSNHIPMRQAPCGLSHAYLVFVE
jgi:hypothetical protein